MMNHFIEYAVIGLLIGVVVYLLNKTGKITLPALTRPPAAPVPPQETDSTRFAKRAEERRRAFDENLKARTEAAATELLDEILPPVAPGKTKGG